MTDNRKDVAYIFIPAYKYLTDNGKTTEEAISLIKDTVGKLLEERVKEMENENE